MNGREGQGIGFPSGGSSWKQSKKKSKPQTCHVSVVFTPRSSGSALSPQSLGFRSGRLMWMEIPGRAASCWVGLERDDGALLSAFTCKEAR